MHSHRDRTSSMNGDGASDLERGTIASSIGSSIHLLAGLTWHDGGPTRRHPNIGCFSVGRPINNGGSWPNSMIFYLILGMQTRGNDMLGKTYCVSFKWHASGSKRKQETYTKRVFLRKDSLQIACLENIWKKMHQASKTTNATNYVQIHMAVQDQPLLMR